ncbi:hypothetical protein SELMODRAFT_6359, partial [Selaginella moellendorffii]
CNLILYYKNLILWSTKTANRGTNCKLRLQEDGNLVLYEENEQSLWASNTNCKTKNCFVNSYLILQDDCRLVLY